MAKLTVITAPDPRLKAVAKPATEVTDEIRQILDDMLEVMYEDNGIGLAAIQVGIEKRLVVIDLEDGPNDSRNPMKLINPVVEWKSDDTESENEGCLSVPYQYAEVKRAARAKVSYLDENGKKHTIEADGLLARCIQHEIDHLDGVLFIDRLSPLKRQIIVKKLLKDRKRIAVL